MSASISSRILFLNGLKKKFNFEVCSRKMSQFVEKHVDLNGQKINYVQEGSGPEGVMLMPGALGTAITDFEPTIKGINTKNEFTVVAWDPPGYGKSRPPNRNFAPNSFELDASIAVDLMEKLGFKKFHAVGWSDGGITAMIAAAENPETISKLVVWGANAYISPVDIEKVMSVRDVSGWSPRIREPMEKIYGADFFPQLWSNWCDFYAEIYNGANKGEICAERLKNIKCKTLIIHGDKDAMLDSVHPAHLNESIRGSRLERFPEGKHNLHFKYKDEFNKIVEDFLIGP